MRVNDYSFGIFVRHTKNNIRRLARNAGKFEQFGHCLRDPASMFIRNDSTGLFDVPGFVAEKARCTNQRFKFRLIRIGKLRRSPVFAKKSRSDDVHHLVCALRR